MRNADLDQCFSTRCAVSFFSRVPQILSFPTLTFSVGENLVTIFQNEAIFQFFKLISVPSTLRRLRTPYLDVENLDSRNLDFKTSKGETLQISLVVNNIGNFKMT